MKSFAAIITPTFCSFAILSGLLGLPVTAACAQTLTLSEAEALALRNDPNLAGLAARAAAFDDLAVADGQLPDPRFKVGLMNWPVQTFERSTEPMNKVDVGISQVFPRGDTLALRSQRTSLEADAERARQRAEALNIVRNVRLNWLDAYYWDHSLGVLHANQKALTNIIEITQFLYSTGRGKQRDVLRAQLEMKLLQDREIEINRQREQARAEISKWIGASAAYRALPHGLPRLAPPAPLAATEAALIGHPEIAVTHAILQSRHTDIELADQGYLPEWSLDLTYGYRGSDQFGNDRSDLLSIMVNVDVPLFTERRQDRRLSAARHAAAAAMYRRDDQLRELKRQLHLLHAEWRRLNERAAFYAGTVIPEADDTLATALRAYQNDVADFTDVMRDQMISFNSRHEHLGLQVARAKARVNLFYLEEPSVSENAR